MTLKKTQEVMTDAQLAEFLDKHDAIDKWEHHGNAIFWRNPENKIVALVFYNSVKTSTYIEE